MPRTIGRNTTTGAPISARSAGPALALACVTQFLVLFDTSVVTVALPSIRAELDVAPTALQWVVHAYTLAFAGLLLLGGRIADLYGHRRVFLGGLAVFTVASLVGGLATDATMLVAARAAQGVGAAVLAPLAVTIVTSSFPEGARRTRALTITTAVALVGGASGNVLGGLATEYLSWRAVLLVNVPIGIPLLVVAARVLRPGQGPTRRLPLDLPGALLATTGLTLLTLGVTQTHGHAWTDPAAALPLLGGLAALGAFVVVEYRFATSPLIPPRLLRLPGIGWGNLAMLLAGASQVPVWYFLTLTMQGVLGYDAATTGVGFLPHAVLMLVAGLWLTPWLMRRVQARVLIAAGALIAAAGFAWQSAVTPDSGYLAGILGPAIGIALGGALVGTPLARTVTAGVDRDDAGAASGLMNTTRQFGGAFGLAALVTLTTTGGPDAAPALAHDYGLAFAGIAVVFVVLAALTPLLPVLRDARPGHDAGRRPSTGERPVRAPAGTSRPPGPGRRRPPAGAAPGRRGARSASGS